MKVKKQVPRTTNLKPIRALIARRKKIGKDKIKFTPQISKINDYKVISWDVITNDCYLLKPDTKEKKGRKPNVKSVLTAEVKKRNWIKKIRNQRILLKANRKQVGENYRKLYREIKGNVFKNKRELLKRINEKKTN